ncbi:tRNA (N6-threonylcarbamoyladenosine(37)-N6)-methyltransferase TrmO [Fusibacter paucivorans]|uniref:tRNA (N6-threonylcarbamoyladenosine(37)-N6)-methyltransferase TrmO n=1 Tax=Fusibacter paucivorans TaxID=76009 RepID=A0ABS5PJH0_9FIRM|nr:tRNA (N6-threonylcarbamoyladenosine(37)-N6)-methyltransferase TrmO [Fusibacter paucivorans]
MNTLEFKAIGVVKSQFKSLEEMPIQPTGDLASPGYLEIEESYVEGLKDLDGFSHLYILYHFHKVKQSKLLVKPFMDDAVHGVFATRAPVRPNAIGMSVVAIDRIEGCRIYIQNLDVLDGTPLLDIKPYVPAFDLPQAPVRVGWLDKPAEAIQARKSDQRFV